MMKLTIPREGISKSKYSGGSWMLKLTIPRDQPIIMDGSVDGITEMVKMVRS